MVTIDVPIEYLEAYNWIKDVKTQGLTSYVHRNMKELSGDNGKIKCSSDEIEEQYMFYAQCYELYKRFAIE